MSVLSKAGRSRDGLVLAGLAVLFLIGVVIVSHYGASVDESKNTRLGEVFLEAYQAGSVLRSPGIEYFNGPFYFMVYNLTSGLFHALNPRWLFTDGVHLTNFLTFLAGVFFFYRIALRLLPRRVALFVTALFATQPVLFGHAFINQKDTPLMAFFLASVELGWTAVESRKAATGNPAPDRTGARKAAEEWKRLSRLMRALIVAGGALGLVLLLDLWTLGGIRTGAETLLGEVHAGRGPAFLVSLFGRVAEDASSAPLTAYLGKLAWFFFWMRLAATVLIVRASLIVWRRALPTSYANVAVRWYRRWGAVVLAGCVLGMTTSIRALAPFAGALVAGYWVLREGRRAIPGLAVYGVAAAVTTYLTWPVLWGNPLLALSQRVSEMSRFDYHAVLFRGGLYGAGSLPWEYLPTLLAIQLTLPAVLLFVFGAPFSWILSRTDRVRRSLVALSWVWLLLPIVTVVLGWVPIYNNFRHLLFALPPGFLIMGFGAWKVSEMIRLPAARAVVAALALAPGIVGIVRLHPYEYIYYNELVGGVRGVADDRFELDYWCTAFREAMGVVNEAAGPEASVAFSPNPSTAEPFARRDLRLGKAVMGSRVPDFTVACRRDVLQTSLYPDMKTMYEVRADGALLAVVRERDGSQ